MYSTPVSLIARLKQPADHDAWNGFVKLYTPFLYRCSLKLGLSTSDAEEAVQEVFILLLAKLPSFQYSKKGSFRAWLRIVTVNKCRDLARKRREIAMGGSEPTLPELADERALDGFWEIDYRQDVIARILESAKSDFEMGTWQAFWQTTVGNRPAAEVARELGVTLNAVYVSRSRVLRKLRMQYGDLLDE